MRLGVDFGTTHTVVAYADRGNYPVLSFADEAGDFHEWFPSVVAEAAEGTGLERLRFGFEALAVSNDEDTVVRSFKRLLADVTAIPSTPVRVGSLTLTLGELITAFLSALKQAILTQSNLPSALQTSAAKRGIEAVIAVPAHAHGGQRFVTLDAFRGAGFSPIAMLNEPSAAGFEFVHRHRTALNARRDHVVVYDLGGGTFDASLVRMRGTHHEVLGTAGSSWLGGDDFDGVLLDRVLAGASLQRSALPQRALDRLLEQCREAKERLSPSSRKLSIDLEAALGDDAARGMPAQVSVGVAEFYEACTPLVEQTVQTMLPVMTRFEGALASEATSNIAGIYVVGGASSLPLVPRQLRKHFGRRVHKSPYPSAAVAIGLAIAADDAAGFELADRYAHTFGVFREGAGGLQITFDPIFTRETSVPARNGDPLSFRRSYRAAHNVGHFRFLECTAISSDGRPCGDVVPSGDVFFPFDAALREKTVELAAVPVQRTSGRGPHIEEEYTLDEHGMVAVTIRNIDADYQRVYRIGGLERRTG